MPLITLWLPRRHFHLCEQLVELLPVQAPTRHNDRANALNVRNVRERIRVQEYQVSPLSGRHAADFLLEPDRHRGGGRVNWQFLLAAAAYNLLRMRTLEATA